MIDNDEVINAIFKLFVSREDAYAFQKDDGGYIKVDEFVSADLLQKHLNGEITIGLYQLSKDSKVKWICYDFDGVNLDAEKERAIGFAKHLRGLGYEPIIEFSGKKGYHVWLFIHEIDGLSARTFADDNLGGYCINEIFPKQTDLNGSLKGYGSLVKLPLCIHRVSKNESYFLHPDNYTQLPKDVCMNLLIALGNRDKKNVPKVIIKERTVEKVVNKDPEGKGIIPNWLNKLIENGATEGNRHSKQYIIEKELYNLGYSREEILSKLLAFNSKCDPPKSEYMITANFDYKWNDKKRYYTKEYNIGDEEVRKGLKKLYNEDEDRIRSNMTVKMIAPKDRTEDDKLEEFNMKVFCYDISKAFLEHKVIKTMQDNEDIYVYNETKGIYEPDGQYIIKRICEEEMRLKLNNNMMTEVMGHIIRSTYTDRNNIFAIDKNKVCVMNGVLNLREKTLSDFSKDYFITNRIPVYYDETKDCPNFKGFLKQVLLDETDIRKMQEIFGYCLWRDYNIQKMFIFRGEGANGKSKLLTVLREFIGKDNVSTQTLQALADDRFAPIRLENKMVNISADVKTTALEDAGMIKMLTGGDLVSVEEKFKTAHHMSNYAKLIASANRLPKSPEDTDAFYRRLEFIMFNRVFKGKDDNKNVLKNILTEEEMSGILNWALDGLKNILDNDTFLESTSSDMTRSLYIKLSDPIEAFVMDVIEVSGTSAVSKTDLYSAYIDFCIETKLPTVQDGAFFKGFRASSIANMIQEIRPEINGKRVRAFSGIRIIDSDKNIEGIDKYQTY